MKANKLTVQRKMRFMEQFMDDLFRLVDVITHDIIDKCVEVCG